MHLSPAFVQLPQLAYSSSSLSTGVKPEPRDTAFSMFIASGPYTPDTDLKYAPFKTLFQSLVVKKPDVVLLVIILHHSLIFSS